MCFFLYQRESRVKKTSVPLKRNKTRERSLFHCNFNTLNITSFLSPLLPFPPSFCLCCCLEGVCKNPPSQKTWERGERETEREREKKKRKRKRVNDLGGKREYYGIKRMGKNVEPRMWINTKKTRRGKAIPCLEETTALMTALKKHNFDASKCVRETELLDKCTSMHAKAPKVKNTINYHLQRLARLARVAR